MNNNDFDIACDFYRAHVNKAFTLSYDQKLTLSALFNQAKHGPFSPETAPEVGLFDFVGKERRAKYQSLGNMTSAEAQDTFVQTLLQICPQFAAYLEANDKIPCLDNPDIEPVDCTDLPPTIVHCTNSHSSAYADSPSKSQLTLTLRQESYIRNALNAQTLEQFRTYAAKYYPDSAEKQAKLIAQLQDRHFHQYMIYMNGNASLKSSTGVFPPAAPKEDALSRNSEQPSLFPQQQISADSETASVKSKISETAAQKTRGEPKSADIELSGGGDLAAHIPNGKDKVEAPQMWTRNDITEFKALLSKDPNSVINIGSGELVTIRFPVDSNGNCLVWEFATDDYDIGFGLSFEWPSEATDRNDKLDDGSQNRPDSEMSNGLWNLIQGSSQPPEGTKSTEAVVDELIPVCRRTSHIEVYCGYHNYPSHSGTYILKFDNTYSYWRNKMLYYRVYWTQ